MKKLFLLYLFLTLLAFSSKLFANNDGYYYLSGNLGIFNADFNNTYLDQTDIIAQNIAQPASQHTYIGGIALGYNKPLYQQYFLGAQLSANAVGNHAIFQSGSSTTAFSDNQQVRYFTDLTLVPGMMLSNTVSAYLKLGLSYAMLRDELTSPAGFTPTTTNYNTNKNAIGFAAGLGLSKTLTQNISLFTEANYHDYGTVRWKNFQNFSATYSHSSHIYSYDVVVGVAYKFQNS